MHGVNAEGEDLTKDKDSPDTAEWSAHASVIALVVGWIPVLITAIKLVNVCKNFVMVASVEAFMNNRMVLLVMRRVQTRSAFLALKLTEIMKRPKLMKKAAKADKAQCEKISVFERMAYKKIFEEFDKDKGGSVTHDELATFMETMNPSLKVEDVKEIVELLDDDHSGEVDFDEFIVFISKVVYMELLEPHGTHDIMKGMFDRIDDDSSGEISVEELCMYLRVYFKDMSVDDTYALIEDFGIDEDGSGCLDFEEFEELCGKLKIFNK
jgi:Ca2+-binding EF-hand superfamily protein